MERETEFLIVGSGIAGASAAYNLARGHRVIMLERESQPGYHSTGRSAAVFTEIYGNDVIRALSVASAGLYGAPPSNFSEVPLWSPRPMLMIGRADQRGKVESLLAETISLVPNLRILERDEVLRVAPILDESYVDCALVEPDSYDLDVNAIHVGFLRGAREMGAQLVVNAEVRAIDRSASGWRVSTSAGDFAARVVIDAAGAWADEIARIAGVPGIGLTPKRRTAFTFAFEPEMDVRSLPTVIDIDEEFYFKPDSGRLLGSPADETPVAPCDAQADEYDIAVAIDRITRATKLKVTSLKSRWAGLRSFVEDKSPVVGFDDAARGFFWLAAQGGYGIQTAPALGRIAAALATGAELPSDVVALGVDAERLSPQRAGLNRRGPA